MNGFWITPEGSRIACSHHYVPAQAVFPDLQAQEAVEMLLRKGYLRCNIAGDDLFYERRTEPTEEQMIELRCIALGESLRVFDHQGRPIPIHQPPSWAAK